MMEKADLSQYDAKARIEESLKKTNSKEKNAEDANKKLMELRMKKFLIEKKAQASGQEWMGLSNKKQPMPPKASEGGYGGPEQQTGTLKAIEEHLMKESVFGENYKKGTKLVDALVGMTKDEGNPMTMAVMEEEIKSFINKLGKQQSNKEKSNGE